MSGVEHKKLIKRDHPDLSVSRQCHLVSISRSSFYYHAKGESAANLSLMKQIDKLFTRCPFYGSRQMMRALARDGFHAGRHRVRRLMGLQAIYQAPRTTVPHPEHRIYPYLLRKMRITRANQVWCSDITYIPVQKGFFISGGDHGLGNEKGLVMAFDEHNGCWFLC